MKPPSRSNLVVSSIFMSNEAGATVMAQTRVLVHRASRLLSRPRQALESRQKRYSTVPQHVIINSRSRQDPLIMGTMRVETKCLTKYFSAPTPTLMDFLCSSNLPASKRVRRDSHASVEVPCPSTILPKQPPTSPETPARKQSSVASASSIKPPSSRYVQCDALTTQLMIAVQECWYPSI